MEKKRNDKNGVTNLHSKDLVKQIKASIEKEKAKKVTALKYEKTKVGRIFVTTVWSHGKPYKQVRRHILGQDGKRRTEIARLTWPSENQNPLERHSHIVEKMKEEK